MADYSATYDISCGVSPGFGVKSPSHDTRQEKFSAEDDRSALHKAVIQAVKFSRDYLSNPAEDDFTTVTLTDFYGPTGKISIRDFLKKQGHENISINGIRYFDWNDQGQLVTKCHMLEHLMLLAAESEAKEKVQAQTQ